MTSQNLSLRAAGPEWQGVLQKTEALLGALERLEGLGRRDAYRSLRGILNGRERGLTPQQVLKLMGTFEGRLASGESLRGIFSMSERMERASRAATRPPPTPQQLLVEAVRRFNRERDWPQLPALLEQVRSSGGLEAIPLKDFRALRVRLRRGVLLSLPEGVKGAARQILSEMDRMEMEARVGPFVPTDASARQVPRRLTSDEAFARLGRDLDYTPQPAQKVPPRGSRR